MAHSACPELSFGEQQRLLRLARRSIQYGIDTGEALTVLASELSGSLANPRGSFVTLTKSGELRGCVGATETRQVLGQNVALAAFSAAFRDRRFAPLSAQELPAVCIEVAVLSASIPVAAASRDELLSQLRPGVDGLVVEADGRRATFLPKVWDKLPDADEFIAQLLDKAGLPRDIDWARPRFSRYTTTSFSESA